MGDLRGTCAWHSREASKASKVGMRRHGEPTYTYVGAYSRGTDPWRPVGISSMAGSAQG